MSELRQLEGKNIFEWTLKDLDEKAVHQSPIFKLDGHRCCITALSFPNDYVGKSYWGFYISACDASLYPLYYTVSIVDIIGQDNFTKKGTVEGALEHQRFLHFISANALKKNKWIGRNSLMLRMNLERSEIFSNVLNCATQTEVFDPFATIDNGTNTDGEPSTLLETLSNDFCTFYESKANTDCVLKVDDAQFPVHRAVLSARSPVFSAMFHHDTTENRNGEVDIPDVEATALGNVLYYLYSGKIRGLTADSAAAMYTVADKYSIIEFRKACLNFLKHSLTMENFCDAALLAHTHGETELEEIVIHFIEDRLKELGECEKWKSFTNAKPLLANKLLYSAFMACKESKLEN